MNILGIETSCDETAAAVVRDGREVLSNIVYSQIALHRPYGGVVPELASRNHVVKLPEVIVEAMAAAGCGWDDIDAVAVTVGPGLATSLLVGIAAAQSLALRLGRPLVPVNHMEAHLYSAFMRTPYSAPGTLCPLTALIVSGGHSMLIRMTAPGRYRLLGQTIDDAAGEAFDKAANLLGLGYPGGPAIDRAAQNGDPKAIRFPRGILRGTGNHERAGGPFGFSYSGVKTALLYHIRDNSPNGDAARIADIAASFQEAIVDTLVRRTSDAMGSDRVLAVAGGVSLNRRLRARIEAMAKERGLTLLLAGTAHCTDNAAMVAALAGGGFPTAVPVSADAIDAQPDLALV